MRPKLYINFDVGSEIPILKELCIKDKEKEKDEEKIDTARCRDSYE